MFRTRETRPGPGALYTPGTAVPARPRMRPVTATCRLAAAGPCHPGATTPSRSVSLTRHQQGFTGIRPSRPFPSPVIPGRNEDPWALPRASHPAGQDPAAHAGAGTGLRHWPGVTPSPSATSFDATHSPRATSCRNALARCPLQPDDGSFSNSHRPSSEGTFRVGAPRRTPICAVD
jgi:hypothetical protein